VSSDEVTHHRDAGCVIENDNLRTILPEEIFSTQVVSILSDNHPRDTVKQRGPGTHDAGAESADQSELRPVTAAASVADADCFRVGGRVSGLHAQIVAASNDASLAVRQDRPDRKTTLPESAPSLFQCFEQ